jgi:hypothetical protein
VNPANDAPALEFEDGGIVRWVHYGVTAAEIASRFSVIHEK